MSMPGSGASVFHAADELFEDDAVEIFAQVRVLDAGVDVRIVVDHDDHGPVAALLDVDPIEPVTDQRCRLDGRPQPLCPEVMNRVVDSRHRRSSSRRLRASDGRSAFIAIISAAGPQVNSRVWG